MAGGPVARPSDRVYSRFCVTGNKLKDNLGSFLKVARWYCFRLIFDKRNRPPTLITALLMAEGQGIAPVDG